LLALLRAAANQNHKPIAISGEVDSIAGAEGDLVFKNPPDPVRTNAKPKLPNEPNLTFCFQQRKNGKANSTEPIDRLPENFLPTTALAEQIPRPADVSSPTLL
jgi:hypothetical protein